MCWTPKMRFKSMSTLWFHKEYFGKTQCKDLLRLGERNLLLLLHVGECSPKVWHCMSSSRRGLWGTTGVTMAEATTTTFNLGDFLMGVVQRLSFVARPSYTVWFEHLWSGAHGNSVNCSCLPPLCSMEEVSAVSMRDGQPRQHAISLPIHCSLRVNNERWNQTQSS